jgi:hypothetical protein
MPSIDPPAKNARWRWAALLLLGLALVLTNRYFTFVEDETWIVSGAAEPAAAIVRAYASGAGMHEHPPLYDLLLHAWLRLTGARMVFLRWPSIAFSLAGLWVLARAARRLAGTAAESSVFWLGVLWPYGFHFERLAAWYSLSFLLVALLTWTYLRALENESFSAWLAVFAASLALVYANYFGWALLACLAADFCRRRWPLSRRDAARLLAMGFPLALAYLPMARAFLGELELHASGLPRLLPSVLYAGFSVYSLFVSESVAPWFWILAVPASVAIAVCLALLVARTPAAPRRFFLYFCLLVALMTALGILTTKRMMLLAPWLLLPMGAILAALAGRRSRAWLVTALVVIAGIGWLGIFVRRFYAAPRFIEPWSEAAGEAAAAAGRGVLVIGNHPSFFFYLSYDLAAKSHKSPFPLAPNPARFPGVYDPAGWIEQGRPVRPEVMLVRGVPVFDAEQAQAWLDRNCLLRGVERELPDAGYRWKQRYFPELGEPRWRIEVRRYACLAP